MISFYVKGNKLSTIFDKYAHNQSDRPWCRMLWDVPERLVVSLTAYLDVWAHIHSRGLIQTFLRLMVSLIYYSAKSLVDEISNILHSNLFTHPLEQMLQLKHSVMTQYCLASTDGL